MSALDRYRIQPGAKFSLGDISTDDDGGLDKAEGLAKFEALKPRLGELQELLYAEAKHALLIVIQAMDTGGKDSLIRSVFTGFNPQGCRVKSFKAPNDVERSHDFLWRIHREVPARGVVGVFNRSHYEDVLIVRVKQLVPAKVWKARYDHINGFEEMLHDEGVTVVKFFLHISKDYQKKRLQRRLDNPEKHWKFDPADLVERSRWDDYQHAYEDAIRKCSTDHAPWYVIPAEHRWYRDLLVTKALVQTLESFDMRFPEPSFDPKTIVIE